MNETMQPPVKEVYLAISRVQGELAKIGIKKKNKNQDQNFFFRSIDDVYKALSPIAVREGLCILPSVIKRESIERETKNAGKKIHSIVDLLITFVSLSDGSTHTSTSVGEAIDTGDKSLGKAISYAFKSMVLASFGVPTEGDNDPDSNSHELKPTPPDPKAVAALEAAAKDGTEELKKTWAALDEQQRELLKSSLVGYKKTAKASDAAKNA